jgi:serine/threonine protein kinase
MPTPSSTQSAADTTRRPGPSVAASQPSYSKTAGEEPLPGYRLIAPLGRGGFGEVWKCEAPGGLHKAIKFVGPDPTKSDDTAGHALRQEYEAFQHIKTIRHPFILQLERVELLAGELVMVMELADAQLQDRFAECAARGLPGIPRAELLGYFADAAEALDVIGAKHGLQHLDVKPANLFLTGGHVKVGDYGLVTRLEVGGVSSSGQQMMNRGLTPRYVAPEVLRGRVDTRSDQYSLALVYQELLTGTYPYPGKTAPQLMYQHVAGTPDLSGLPDADRAAVARALSKDPADRFPSCLAFVQALMTIGLGPDGRTPPDPGMDLIRRNRVDRSMADISLPPAETMTGLGTAPVRGTDRVPAPSPPESVTLQGLPSLTVPGVRLPPLTTAPQAKKPAAESDPPTAPAKPERPAPPPAFSEIILTPAPILPRSTIRLKPIYSVVPVARLLGQFAEPSMLGPDHFIDAVVGSAAGGSVPRSAGEATLLPDGTWACRFPSTLLPSVAPLKLTTLMEDGWCDEIVQPDTHRILLRVRAGGGGILGKIAGSRGSGAEILIRLPTGSRPAAGRAPGMSLGSRPGGSGVIRQSAIAIASGTNRGGSREVVGGLGEVEVTGYVFGNPDQTFARKAVDGIPQLMEEVRRLLQNVPDRRKHPRIPASCAVTIYPITEDGMVQTVVSGLARDVSAGGVCCVTQGPIPTRYVFVEFPEVAVTSGLAILTRLTRSNLVGYEQVVAGRFRVDL